MNTAHALGPVPAPRPRRKAGTGSVTPLKNPDGSIRGYWARLPSATGKVASLDVWPTHEEAERVLDAAVARLAKERLSAVGGVTLAGFMPGWLDRRELGGNHGMASTRSRAKCHVYPASIATRPMRSLRRSDIKDFLDGAGKKLSPGSVELLLVLVRSCLDDALDRGLIETNPAARIKLKAEARTEEPWTFLEPSEQQRLLAAIPEPERWIVAFALGSGLRRGEVWNLELRDLHVTGDHPHVFVRYGAKGRAPKGGKTRTVALFGLALQAAQEWLRALPTYARVNEAGLAFPGRQGGRRRNPPEAFKKWVAAAGIARNVRWHDLRHTFGSSLVAGWWGRAWRLEEIREEMGHSTIAMTERYAHLGDTARKAAAREAREGYANVMSPKNPGESQPGLKLRDKKVPCDLAAQGTSHHPAVAQIPPSRIRALALLTLEATRARDDALARDLATVLARHMGERPAPGRAGYWARITEMAERVVRMTDALAENERRRIA